MAQMEGIKACVFDAYGTLFDVGSPVAKLAAELGGKAQPLAEMWRRKQLEYTWLRSLMGVHADFWHVTAEALAFCLESLGINEAGLHDELMAFYLKLDAYADVAESLQALKTRGKRIAILSNGSPSMLDSAVRAAGLGKLVELIISVEDVGIYKPSRRVYRHALHRLQIADAPAVCFVSANGWDAHGAAQFGFQTVRLLRTPAMAERLPGKPTASIASLGELSALL